MLLLLWACKTEPEESPRWIRGTALAPRPEDDTLHSQEGLLVDCDARFAGLLGQHWFAFVDTDPPCRQGNSRSWLEILADESDDQRCTVRWTGSVGSAYQYGFAGVGSELTMTNLYGYRRIVLETRGDGQAYRMALPMLQQMYRAREARNCDDKNYDFYGQLFACGDGSENWVPTIVDLEQLSQQGWGNVWPLRLEDVYQLQIQTTSRPLNAFQCDFRVLRIEE